ncbi:MAG: hypothetical protein IID40_01655 [Planctomycetes bacterium]|nr:hypothetical protein [Planctomycetota bacterium]
MGDVGRSRGTMDLHGIINFHKHPGITSAKALYAVRKVVGQRKSGHAGTLDPAADGVLVLCLGRATKLVEQVMDQPKVYRARARLDVTSASFDSDRPLVDVAVGSPPDEAAVRAALERFVGEIQQVPPAVSAIKVGGQASYKLERRGQAVPLKARPARIYSACSSPRTLRARSGRSGVSSAIRIGICSREPTAREAGPKSGG